MPHSGALSTVAAGAPLAHRPLVHSLPGARRPAPGGIDALLLPLQTSAGVAADLLRLPSTISFTRWLRHALTRRCKVRNCGFAAYASGTIAANRSINSLADTVGSAINQPSMTGHASANGSGRFRHQCLVLGCLRVSGKPVAFFRTAPDSRRMLVPDGARAGRITRSWGYRDGILGRRNWASRPAKVDSATSPALSLRSRARAGSDQSPL